MWQQRRAGIASFVCSQLPTSILCLQSSASHWIFYKAESLHWSAAVIPHFPSSLLSCRASELKPVREVSISKTRKINFQNLQLGVRNVRRGGRSTRIYFHHGQCLSFADFTCWSGLLCLMCWEELTPGLFYSLSLKTFSHLIHSICFP